jgi:integral membrane sensor domain MASE1
MAGTVARRAALAVALVAGVVGYGLGVGVVGEGVGPALAREGIRAGVFGDVGSSSWPATVRCAGLAEDSAAHVRLVVFDRQADGSVRLVYRCERGGY